MFSLPATPQEPKAQLRTTPQTFTKSNCSTLSAWVFRVSTWPSLDTILASEKGRTGSVRSVLMEKQSFWAHKRWQPYTLPNGCINSVFIYLWAGQDTEWRLMQIPSLKTRSCSPLWCIKKGTMWASTRRECCHADIPETKLSKQRTRLRDAEVRAMMDFLAKYIHTQRQGGKMQGGKVYPNLTAEVSYGK